MDAINAFHIEKTQEGRKKKQKVTEVEPARVDKEEHERRKKNPHSRNPKRVVHLKMRKLQMKILFRLVPMRLSLLA